MTRESAIMTRYVPLSAGFGGEVDDARAWLTVAERDELARFRHPLRRRQWLAGRWLSKQLLYEAYGEVSLAEVQILTRDERGLGSRPQVSIRRWQAEWSLSISHTEGGVLVALAPTAMISVGVDLTGSMPCDERFQRLWFTASERRWVNDDPRRATIVWSIKEAVYKACQTGQGWSPRLVEVESLPAGRFVCTFAGQIVDDLRLSIEEIDSQIATVAWTSRWGLGNAVDTSWSTEETTSTELALASCS